jgi:hypothetical protein
MKYPMMLITVLGLTAFSSVQSYYDNDRRTANVAYSTAGGALVGGALGGPRWAAAGAGVGFGLGVLSNSAKTPEERERERIYREQRNQGRLEALYDEHDKLMIENKNLVAQVEKDNQQVMPFGSTLESRSFTTAQEEMSAIKKEIHTLKSENRKLKKKVKKLQKENRY